MEVEVIVGVESMEQSTTVRLLSPSPSVVPLYANRKRAYFSVVVMIVSEGPIYPVHGRRYGLGQGFMHHDWLMRSLSPRRGPRIL